ncbi:MAG: CBS domain-containing protein, partial [Candidatus Latescibacterota bacterium]|nr:CBS domain-containing protein [Candidatus Latescibacterota bacterium]
SERSSHYHARTSGSIADFDDWQDDGRDLTVADIMSTNVVTAHRGTPVKELAEMMVSHDIHRIVILDGSNLVGIVGTLDILRAVSQGRLS